MKLFFLLIFLVSLNVRADETPVSPSPQELSQIKANEEKEDLRILYYKPIYFAYGNPLTKLQFSFRSPLFEEIPFNFAYSQIIFWELGADSKPFLDATYNPEFFYRWKVDQGSLQTVDFGAWEHNSNGKAGDASRSYDQSYVRLNYGFEGKRWITQFSAKIKILYDNDEENADIYDFVSPLEFGLRFQQIFNSFLDRGELDFNFHPGGRYAQDFDKGGYEIGVNFHAKILKVVPAFYIQYYRGYAETLLNYNQRVEELRAGLMF